MPASDLGSVVQRGLSKAKKYDAVEMKPLAGADDDDDPSHGKRKLDEWLEWLWRKLHALLWIVVAGALASYLQLIDVMLDGHPPGKPDRQLHRFAFNIGLAGFGGWLSIAAYLVIWLKYILKVEEEWEEYSPRAIPLATACAVASLVAFVVALWPVFSGWSVLIVFVEFLGLINVAHFVPL
ncbi:hypothetical protein AB1Y20_009531 [Prymnesium parvum]|uniref:Uncharacterized protein n=1 Tax=Prymnesium parvum TaxID=97485 RepID=A0AB34K2B1_PRYPA